MPSFYDTEVEEQKRSGKVTNIALPVLAALEAIGTSIATKGRNPTSNALGIYKDVQSGREAALERATRRDEAAPGVALKKRELAEYDKKDKARADAINRYLGLPDLTEEDKANIQTDPYKWQEQAPERKINAASIDPEVNDLLAKIKDVTSYNKAKAFVINKYGASAANKLMGSSARTEMTMMPRFGKVTDAEGNVLIYNPETKTAEPLTMDENPGGGGMEGMPGMDTGKGPNKPGKVVKVPPPSAQKTPEQIAADTMARIAATAAAERAEAAKTTIPGLTTIPGATITNDGVKKVQDIAVRKDELVQSIKRLQDLYKLHGTQLYGDKAREMESLVKGIQLTAKEFYNLGVLNGPDLGLMETMIANPTGIKENLIGMTPGAGDPVTPKLKEAMSLIDNRFKSTINRYGFQEASSSLGAALKGAFPTPKKTGAPDRKVLARQALNDPEATPEEKAQAQKILAGP